MKKKNVLIMCGLLSLALTACGGKNQETIANEKQGEEIVVSQEQVDLADTEEAGDDSASKQEETVLPDNMLVSDM